MRITLAQLEAFYWTYRLGGFHAAARQLHLAQPTVSVRIRDLERALNTKLFVRDGRRIRPSPDGTGLLQHADQMLTLARRITGDRLVFDPLQFGLRLGAPDSFALVCLPAVLSEIESDYPELEIALVIENSATLNRLLKQNDLDLAFLSNPQLDSQFRCEPLGGNDVAWFAPRGADLPSRGAGPADLARHHVFTNPEPSPLFGLVRDWFLEAGVGMPRISTCNNLSVVARMTAAGAGISVLPTAIVRQEVRSGQVRRLQTRPPLRPQPFFAAYRSSVAGRGVDVVLASARKVIARKQFLV